MKFTSDNAVRAPAVLYHAVSSYQLLEVMLHRMVFHEQERAALILPDFIVKKYPQYRKLASKKFFDEVYLFPYLHILHRREDQIIEDVRQAVEKMFPDQLRECRAVYVAGAHFYFSLYLIKQGIPFTFFEDAAGMLSRSQEIGKALSATFPIHAAIAEKYGLFDGQNPNIQKIICLKSAQTKAVSSDQYQDFSVEKVLQSLPNKKRNRLIHFFLRRRLRTNAQAILLTQHFANLGMMSEEQQRRLYQRLKEEQLQGVRLVVKRHPDDTLDYREIFPHAKIIKEVFPAELLPYAFWKQPQRLYAFDSTGCENLKEHFTIIKIRREKYAE